MSRKRLQIDAAGGVRIAGVPARVLHVVVEHVADVPAEHHVAEAHGRFGHRRELFQADPFAAQHAVDIDGAQLDAADLVLPKLFPNVAEIDHSATQTDFTLVYWSSAYAPRSRPKPLCL